jgi:predicted O-methyltransferase YrrM
MLRPLKAAVMRFLRWTIHTRSGRKAFNYLVAEEIEANPEFVLESLFMRLNGQATFDGVPRPQRLHGFEDLAFLFSSNHLNVGIAILTFEEAAYLYRLIHSLRQATLVEIGRFKGGSTFLMAAAMDEQSQLYSYDWFSGSLAPLPKSSGVDRVPAQGSNELDRSLKNALAAYGLAGRVHLLVADSHTAQPPPAPCDLIFIDGDHSYEGVLADFRHWTQFLRPGGHLLFHDAYPRQLAPAAVGVTKLVEEISANHSDRFIHQAPVGSIAHFVKRQS